MTSLQNPLVFNVIDFIKAVSAAVEDNFSAAVVEGEVCNLIKASSGHWYFSLKDENDRQVAQVKCAAFGYGRKFSKFDFENGDRVRVFGKLGIYTPRGDLQLSILKVEPAGGLGRLFEAFERLKNKLKNEGLFDICQRDIIKMPRAIALVTSPLAAAFSDVKSVLEANCPHLPVYFSPASVQGALAPAEIIRALELIYARVDELEIDAILLVRGGGAMEDLWAFNDENLARMIIKSPVPIICGVGHETDFSIADWAADARAATPTAAAQMVSAGQKDLLNNLNALNDRLINALDNELNTQMQNMDYLSDKFKTAAIIKSFYEKENLRIAGYSKDLKNSLDIFLQKQINQTDFLENQLSRLFAPVANEGGLYLEELKQRIKAGTQRVLYSFEFEINSKSEKLNLLNPDLVLKRGYALLKDENGRIISSVNRVNAGEVISANLADGDLNLKVLKDF